MERQFLIRDMRNGDWLWVYRKLIGDSHLTNGDKLVYQSLASFAGMKQIKPSYKTIGERVNLTKRAAINGIQRLVEVGYVAITEEGGGRHKTNEYLLLKMPKGCKLCTLSRQGERVNEKTEKGERNARERVNEKTPDKDIKKDIKNSNFYLNLLKERGELTVR